MREYELTFIGKPDMDNTNLNVLVERVKGYIAAESGTVMKTDMWGMRHLTYPIRKYRDGHYVHMLVQLESAAVARVEARLRLTEELIRYLLVLSEDETPVAAPATDAGEVAAA
jgi:small subunit ribosomal protein S6